MTREKKKEAPGVMIYFSEAKPVIECLSNEQIGALFKAIILYAQGKEIPELDNLAGMAFAIMRPRIDRDKGKYVETVEQRKYAVYVRECRKKKVIPTLFEEWIDNGAGGEEKAPNKAGVDYYDYMQSDAWIEKRNQRIAIDGFHCHLCGDTGNLEVHHLTYEHLGDEKMEELITLCHDCHKKQHEALRSGPISK